MKFFLSLFNGYEIISRIFEGKFIALNCEKVKKKIVDVDRCEFQRIVRALVSAGDINSDPVTCSLLRGTTRQPEYLRELSCPQFLSSPSPSSFSRKVDKDTLEKEYHLAIDFSPEFINARLCFLDFPDNLVNNSIYKFWKRRKIYIYIDRLNFEKSEIEFVFEKMFHPRNSCGDYFIRSDHVSERKFRSRETFEQLNLIFTFATNTWFLQTWK